MVTKKKKIQQKSISFPFFLKIPVNAHNYISCILSMNSMNL